MRRLAAILCALQFWLVAGAQKDFSNRGNYLSLGHEYVFFNSGLSDWNTTTIEGKLNTGSWVFLPRFYLADRFGETGWALEQDAYKKFESEDYLLLQAAYSPSQVFSNYRLGAEFFNSFGKTWEQSLGIRVMHFHNSLTVFMGTASLSKYSGRFLSILRANIGVQNHSSVNTLNAGFQQRYYFSDERWLSLFTGYGYDPDLTLFSQNNGIEISGNTTFSIGLLSRQPLGNRWALEPRAEFQWLDFGSLQRKQYTIAVKLFYRW